MKEIDDFITLKSYDKALKKINQLKEDKYNFHKYKMKLFIAQLYFEESVSHAIEMWKHGINPFHELEHYLYRALINHYFHFKDRVQESLQKFEADINILYSDESAHNIHLLIKYLELKIELNEKDSIKRGNYIEELLNIAPKVMKFQYELLSLSYQDEEYIREKLHPLVEQYDSVIKETSPLNRILRIRDLLGAVYIKIGDLENARIQLEGAMELIGDNIPDIRESLESKLSELNNASDNNAAKNMKPPFQYIKADQITLYTQYSHGVVKFYYASYISDGKSYILYCKGKAKTFLKSECYLSVKGGRSCNYASKEDWMRDFYYSTKQVKENIERTQQETLVQAKLIEGKITGMINIGKGELVTLRGPMGSGKSAISNYLLGVEYPEKGEIIIDGTLLGELEDESMRNFRNNNMALVIEGRVIIPKNIMKDQQEETDIVNFINDFVNDHPEEIISAVNDLKNSMDPINNFFYRIMAIFKLKPKLILMNEPFMNLCGELLENWFKVLNMLAKHHEIAIVLETHHVISSFHADCQYFIRDYEIIEIIESSYENPAKIIEKE